MPVAHAKRSLGKARTILVIDVGGTHVKSELSAPRRRCDFKSGRKVTAKGRGGKGRRLTDDWTYDVVSIGYPGPVAGNRPMAEPYNLGSGWRGFDFVKAFHRSAKVINDAAMQALGSYRGGCMLFLGLGTGLGSGMIIYGGIVPLERRHLP